MRTEEPRRHLIRNFSLLFLQCDSLLEDRDLPAAVFFVYQTEKRKKGENRLTSAQIRGLFRFLLENRKLPSGIGQRILCRILRGIREEKQDRENVREMSEGGKKDEMR